MPRDEQRLMDTGDAELQNRLIANILTSALQTGEQSLKRGPELLPILRESGVVDAGAYGLTVIIAGFIAALRGEELPDLPHHVAPVRDLHLPQHESSEFRYCTNFAVTGSGLISSDFVPALEDIGDSVLVVGDESTLKVHVHTDDPDQAMAIFTTVGGEVSRLDVADMREQVADRTARLFGSESAAPNAACGIVAVVNGAGLEAMYRDLGAYVVDGGPTMNPSTYDLLAGIHAVGAHEAIVLPNSPNVRLAAERAAELSEIPASVVPTRSQQQGLLALIAFDSTRGAAENCVAVDDAATALTTAGVARAARDDGQGRFKQGDTVGYLGEDLVAWGEPATVIAEVLSRAGSDAEVLTVIAGEDAPLDEHAVETLAPDGPELEQHRGGQSAWWYLVAAE
jgi:dihydroxyacetone kinase-like predicted kinase